MAIELKISRDRLDEQLQISIAKGYDIGKLPQGSAAERQLLLQSFRSWDEFNGRLLEQAFVPVSWRERSPRSQYADLGDITFLSVNVLGPDQAPTLIDLISEKVRKLESLRASLDLFDEGVGVVAASAVGGPSVSAPAAVVPRAIFLVHGRDNAARLQVQRVLEKATPLEVIVLADQPNSGQTIIEKLEGHFENSAFAVILMTADDEGRLKGSADLQSRARQNVILELGYAAAKLGRRNVAILFEDGVEMPSDFHGVGRTLFDSGNGWILEILAEMKVAGIEADLNKLMP
ncbi:TIR domain-containing protein [Pseudofrankia inefficax]|uniref:Nucleotide-binding protein n=1 Tax=Pseudofrankia inefficax (strain DSM 45817 / CECT 9037 / DDB 130130 / EuI1c) TaxID=298654 RepID=E3J264_PSEI1|nr:nucleotide-binding protein [Pseudofrankia inefficax]ADP78102.1 nucleotide-binding protein [Pseudofrankia inefficax]